MKTKLILGSLLALAMASNAQQWTSGAGSDIYKTSTSGNTGVGTSSPGFKLDVQTSATGGDGIRVKQTGSSGSASLRLENATTGGHNYALFSFGNGDTPGGAGHLMLYDYTDAAYRFMIQGGTGNVGIGTTSPAYKLHLETSASNDGIYIKQTYGEASALHLDNGSAGGQHWALFSTGNGNGQGSGNFSIYQYATGAGDRLFIDGSSGNVGIGMITPTDARLEVKQDGGSTFNRGIFATALRTTGSAPWNAGIEGRGGGSTECTGGESYGVIGRAYNGGYNYGGYFEANDVQGCSPYLSVGVCGSGSYGGLFYGNVEYTGTLTGPSDRKLKENITPLENILDKIKLLKPSRYTYKVNEFKDMRLPEGTQMGLIAQELEQVFPELVKNTQEITRKNEKGEVMTTMPEHKSVNYINLIPVLIAGIQEQQKTIESLQSQLDGQKQVTDQLSQKSSATTGINSINSVEAGFQMSQNEPNPFTHETVVKYTLPQTISNAFMAVYDLTGKQITTFPIDQKGSSSITITSEKLAAGIYIYSIVADGKVMDSKRMIVADK